MRNPGPSPIFERATLGEGGIREAVISHREMPLGADFILTSLTGFSIGAYCVYGEPPFAVGAVMVVRNVRAVARAEKTLAVITTFAWFAEKADAANQQFVHVMSLNEYDL